MKPIPIVVMTANPREALRALEKQGEDNIWRTAKAAGEEMDRTAREIVRLREGLERSVVLQSHYACLLNMHDGGTRMEFASADAWLKRLAEIAQREAARENVEVL